MRQRSKTPVELLPALALALLAAGCSMTRPRPVGPTGAGKVHYRQVKLKHTAHYTLKPGQSYSGGTLRQNSKPVYPKALVGKNPPPTSMLARLTIGTDGRVHAVYIGQYHGQTAYRQAFGDAVRKAAKRWVFSPLTFTRTVTRPGKPAITKTRTKPYSLWFEFYFKIVDGHPVTSSHGRQPLR